MKKVLFGLSILLFLASCGANESGQASEETKQLQEKYDAVMAMHDEAMIYFSPLETSINTLNDLLTSTDELEESTENDAKIVLEQVKKASDDMMSWMSNHKGLEQLAETDMTFADKVEYLEKDLQSITKNNDDCKNSLMAAKELFEALELDVDINLEEHHDHDHDHEGHDHSHHDHGEDHKH